MGYIATNTIRDALAAWAKSFQVSGLTWAEWVGAYDSPDLLPAINDLLVLSAARVILVVPGQERYSGSAAPGLPLLRYRYSTFTVMLALRVDGPSAAGVNAEQIAEIAEITTVKDAFIEQLVSAEELVPGVSLYPTDGGPQDIRDQADPDRAMWRAWIARFETPAGATEYENATF